MKPDEDAGVKKDVDGSVQAENLALKSNSAMRCSQSKTGKLPVFCLKCVAYWLRSFHRALGLGDRAWQ